MNTKFANVTTELPGPKSAQLLQRKQAAVPAGAYHNLPVFVDRAENALIHDIDGNAFIDFAAGIGVMNVGHANQSIVTAVAEQAARFTHTCFHLTMYEPYVALAEKLNALLPGDFAKKSYFVNSGAEAIENAVKIARHATGRHAILAFEHGFHGRTLLGMSLTGKVMPYRKGFGPMAPEVYHLPFPARGRVSESYGIAGDDKSAVIARIKQMLATRVVADEIAAFIFEPVLGEGGIQIFDKVFMQALFEFARENGSLLIADEIQTGWGRTGTLFALEQFGVAADLTATAKSIAGGLPLGAITGKAEVMDHVHPGGIGSTFGGNPVACAAALAAVNFVVEQQLPKRAIQIGAQVREQLTALQQKYDIVADVRGIGAMNGIEFVKSQASMAPAPERVAAIQKACAERGLIVLKAGSFGNVIRMLMPLTIEDEVLDEGLRLFAEAVQSVA